MMPRKQELQPCSFTENCSLEMSGQLIEGKGGNVLIRHHRVAKYTANVVHQRLILDTYSTTSKILCKFSAGAARVFLKNLY